MQGHRRPGRRVHILARWLASGAILVSPTVFGGMAAAAAASAGEAERREPKTEAAEDIVVTARRVAENVQSIPVAVTAVSTEEIDRLAINTPLDLNKLAGLGGVPIGSLTNVNFTIRGQGTAFGGQQGVIPYFAEVPNFPLSYFDLQSIQVIKGPQGTLFGQSSTGGVVLFEPRRPTGDWAAELEVQLGSREYVQLEGALNLPILGERLQARLSFQLRNREGWGRAVYADGRPSTDLNNIDNASVRASLLWRPTDRFETLLIYAQDRLRNHGNLSPLYYIDTRFMNPAARNLVPAAIPSLANAFRFWTGYSAPAGRTYSQLLGDAFSRQLTAGPLTMFTDYVQRNRTENRGWISQSVWDLGGGVRLRNIAGLRYSTVRGATYDQDASDLPLLDFQCKFAVGATDRNSPCAAVGGWPDRTFTEELQLQGRVLGDRLEFQLGAFYLAGGSRRYREDTRPFIVFGNLSGDPASAAFCASVAVPAPCASMSRTRVRSHALFGQASFELADGLRATGGYRQTWDRTRTETTGKASYRVPFNGFLIAMPVYGERPASGASVVTTIVKPPSNGSYNLSLDWAASDAVLLYLAHRSGYKPGGINTVANPGTPQRIFGPERSKDLELGAKTDWQVAGIRGRFNLALFQTWYSDIQLGQIIPGTAQTVTANLADARIRGVEVDATARLTPWLRLDGNLAYTDGDYRRWAETTTCAAQFWRPQCAGLPGSTPIAIDHARGRLDVAGQQIAFRPDRFANTSKWQWSVRPALLLKSVLGEEIEASANIYGRTAYVDATAVTNTSKLAGVAVATLPNVFGGSTADPFDAPGYGLVDLRLDWRHVRGSNLHLAAGVTNLSNKIYRVSSASAFEIIGDVYSLVGEPRMVFISARVTM